MAAEDDSSVCTTCSQEDGWVEGYEIAPCVGDLALPATSVALAVSVWLPVPSADVVIV